jgi:hypothetical protein
MFVEFFLITVATSICELLNTLTKEDFGGITLGHDINNLKLLLFVTSFLANHIQWIGFAAEYRRDRMNSSLRCCK